MTGTFDLTLSASHPAQPAPLGRIGDADPRDLALILALWRGGPACQAVALDMAAKNHALSRTPALSPEPKAAIA